MGEMLMLAMTHGTDVGMASSLGRPSWGVAAGLESWPAYSPVCVHLFSSIVDSDIVGYNLTSGRGRFEPSTVLIVSWLETLCMSAV